MHRSHLSKSQRLSDQYLKKKRRIQQSKSHSSMTCHSRFLLYYSFSVIMVVSLGLCVHDPVVQAPQRKAGDILVTSGSSVFVLPHQPRSRALETFTSRCRWKTLRARSLYIAVLRLLYSKCSIVIWFFGQNSPFRAINSIKEVWDLSWTPLFIFLAFLEKIKLRVLKRI